MPNMPQRGKCQKTELVYKMGMFYSHLKNENKKKLMLLSKHYGKMLRYPSYKVVYFIMAYLLK